MPLTSDTGTGTNGAKSPSKFEDNSSSKFGMGSTAGGILTEDELHADTHIYCCVIIRCIGAINKKEVKIN